ncbi:MAG: lysoplasmalogenase family protein, partial [Acidimicrobiia bacterium]|nr:lysoplasmalogenase family protein [Acidimicrobiia bacterium]
MAWAALGTAAAVGWLLMAERSSSPARLVAKPLASAGFLTLAVTAGAADSAFGRWMLVALGLSALGDVLLLGESDASFLGGLGSFLVAHLAFAAAFAVRGLAVAGLVSAVLLGLVAGASLRWLKPHISGRMQV